MLNAPCTTLIFDLDGTLVDSAPDLTDALNQVLTAQGRSALNVKDVAGMIGDGVAKLVERGFMATGGAPLNPAAALSTFQEIYLKGAANLTALYPTVLETLGMLRDDGYRMGLCTNKPIAPTRSLLKALDISGFFEVVAGGDSFPVRKPDPGHVNGVLDQLGSTRDNTIMIGDSKTDVAAAKSAGVTIIAVSYGYPRGPIEDLGADIIIDSFDAVPDAIATLSGKA
ncbi:MAG: phosphoglycolate phosphatase [Alphaproteobacteria bacterium]|nr:phosphoglycolate phosphatase [Alphaproteobacteria bacterium]